LSSNIGTGTLFLTAITAIAAVASSWLSYMAIRTQRKIGQDSIEVAKNSIRVTIGSERPWIVVRPTTRDCGALPSWAPGQARAPAPEENIGPIIPAFSGTYGNIGKSVAEITAISIRYVRLRNYADRLPDRPEYPESIDTLILAAPGEQFAFSCGLETEAQITEDEMQGLNDGRERWYAYGRIRYKDNHGGQHVTRFLYRYKHPARDRRLADRVDAFEAVALVAYVEVS
jgi:hypothetical protein